MKTNKTGSSNSSSRSMSSPSFIEFGRPPFPRSDTLSQSGPLNYCAESCHFCANRLTEKLEKLTERALRFVYQDKVSPYETLVVKNGYSTLANQRLEKNAKYNISSDWEWKRTYKYFRVIDCT